MRKRNKITYTQQVFPFWKTTTTIHNLKLSDINTNYELQQSKEHWKNYQKSISTP